MTTIPDDAATAAAAPTSPAQLDDYERMAGYRAFEEAVAAGVVSGQIHGEMHLGIGQEAVASALARHLTEPDAVVSTHRSHLHALAVGVDPVELLAEIYERDGLNHGKGGHMHLFDPGRRFMCTGIVGASAPLALGYALAQQFRDTGGLTVAVAGDGAMNQGGVAESMNLACVRRLPVLFLVEDNGWSISVPRSASTAGSLAGRATVLGMPVWECDGLDFESVDTAIAGSFTQVREQGGPASVVARVSRFRGHYEGDPDLYRSAAEKDEQMSPARDPLARLASLMRDRGVTDQELNAATERARNLIQGWVSQALQRPLPSVNTARTEVFADV